MKKYWKLMRVHHYMKNLLLLLPLFFSGRMPEGRLFWQGLLAFVAFSLLASAIYIFNDMMDVERDRSHSTKKNRPLASGEISMLAAKTLAGVLLILSFACHFLCGWLSPFSPWAVLYLLAYLGLNVAYSRGLKAVPLMDIAILASGYLIRVLYGAALSGILVSNWLYLTVTAAAFYLGFGKRRGELLREGQTREVLAYYSVDYLDKSMYMCLGLVLVFYSLWCADPTVLPSVRAGGIPLVWTVPLVLLICLKYNLNIEKSSDGDPVEVVLHDKWLLALVFLFAAATVGAVYW